MVRNTKIKIYQSHCVGHVFRSSTGYELMLCSLDGTVIYIELNEKELGRPVSDQQKVGHVMY
jgi:hypothetical protein